MIYGDKYMIFNSIQYLLFLPITVLMYYIMPKKLRYIWLLIVSYYFYMCWNFKYAALIALSTLITYLSGIGIQFCRKKLSNHEVFAKLIVAVSLVSNLGILLFFKYFEWILNNINQLLHLSISSPFSLVLPVGISFYTFQALSYTIDVYRRKITAEKNFFRYALFVSFFPQLVAGPIERSGNLLSQLKGIDCKKIDFAKIRDGLCLILYGFFLKLVIADRASILVDTVFNNYTKYGFIELMTAAVLFAFQILCDFNGYTIIAQGSAVMLGITLMDNFRQPYLAVSVNDFWRRWHISLTSWFTDYLYIPLGGNRKGTFRKMANTMIVFLVSGIWHGASWHFAAWGGLHGLYQNFETGIRTQRRKLHVQKGAIKFSTRLLRALIVFTLVDIAWVFFRAPDCGTAILFFRQMSVSFQNVSLLELGLKGYDWFIIIFSIITMFCVDILHEKRIQIRKWLYAENLWFRWLIYLAAFWIILLFGVYGASYDVSQFIYFQF